MTRYYCDGSTLLNGQVGQDSSILVVKPNGFIHREHIGNYTINYAELFAIKRAAEFASGGEEIITDSLLSFNWITKRLKRTKGNAHLVPLILEIKNTVAEKKLVLTFKRRDENKAGWEIEKNPFYK